MRAVFFALILVATLLSRRSLAAPGDAEQEFAAAQGLFDARSFDKALPRFQKLAVETNSPNARLYVARCLRELGHLAEADEEMRLTLTDARARAEREPRYASTRDSAASELALLDQRVGKVVIALVDPPADLSVTVNGAALAREKLGVAFAIQPGEVVVKATGRGAERVERATISAGETRTIALSLTAVARPVIATHEPASSVGRARILGFVVGGVGAASLIASGVIASMAASDFEAAKTACHGEPCPKASPGFTTQTGAIDAGKPLDAAANVLLVGGIVVLTTGAALVIFGGPTHAPAVRAPSMSFTVAPRAIGVRGNF